MMYCDFLIFFVILSCTKIVGDRRIVGGHTTNTNATFMVYILAANGKKEYNEWLCGGAIVDRWFIITSIACLDDVQSAYVVAGYNTYVSGGEIDDDVCISNTKKTIESWFYQSQYDLGNYQTNAWTIADIALAKVDVPFDFQDPVYLQYCSYLPSIINIGFDDFYRRPGAPVIAYGWGHKSFYRPLDVADDLNSKVLFYASTRVMQTSECIEAFVQEEVKTAIKNYGICTLGPGYLNDQGNLINLENKLITHCSNRTCRRWLEARRQTLCQNDHGGPLVTWYGGRMYLIGVATAFRVRHDLKCVPPSVFTSTACTAKFLQCMLSQTRRFNDCANEKGIQITVRNKLKEKDDAGSKDHNLTSNTEQIQQQQFNN